MSAWPDLPVCEWCLRPTCAGYDDEECGAYSEHRTAGALVAYEVCSVVGALVRWCLLPPSDEEWARRLASDLVDAGESEYASWRVPQNPTTGVGAILGAMPDLPCLCGSAAQSTTDGRCAKCGGRWNR